MIEETGLKLTLSELVGVYQYFAKDDQQFVRFTFKVSIAAPTVITPLDRQIIAGHWLTLAQIKQLDNLRSPLVIQCIEDSLRQGTSAANVLLKSPLRATEC